MLPHGSLGALAQMPSIVLVSVVVSYLGRLWILGGAGKDSTRATLTARSILAKPQVRRDHVHDRDQGKLGVAGAHGVMGTGPQQGLE